MLSAELFIDKLLKSMHNSEGLRNFLGFVIAFAESAVCCPVGTFITLAKFSSVGQ